MATIRRAVPGDLRVIGELEDKCFGEQAYPRHLLYMLMLLYPDLFLVYELPLTGVIGYASGVVRRRLVCHIMSICVDPSFRRRGVGRALMREMERRFRDRGCLVARLEAAFTNTAAIRLYTGMGYRPALFRHRYYPDGRPALVMFKALLEQDFSSETTCR